MDTISKVEIYAGIILLLSATKFIYDFGISPGIRKWQKKNGGKSAKEIAKAKGKRDKWANAATFFLTLALSALVLIEGFRQPDVSQADIEELQRQIDELNRAARIGRKDAKVDQKTTPSGI